MKKVVIVYNPKSGKVKSKYVIEDFYSMAEKYDLDLQVITTKRRLDATNIVKNLPDDISLVIAAGGDGTLNESIRGNLLRKKKLLMAHLPFGTTNDVGTMYGFSKNYLVDLEWILTGEKKNIDIILINNTPFIYCGAFGNFVNISYDTPKKLKETFGRIGYILFGMTEINEKIRMNHIKYKVNGEAHEGDYSFLFITNSTRIGGVDNIYKDVKLDDNKFEVLFCKIKSKPLLVKALYHIRLFGVNNIDGCEYYKTDSLDIEFSEVPKFSWCIDGEEYKPDTNKFEFRINKDINLLMPTNNINKLFVDKE